MVAPRMVPKIHIGIFGLWPRMVEIPGSQQKWSNSRYHPRYHSRCHSRSWFWMDSSRNPFGLRIRGKQTRSGIWLILIKTPNSTSIGIDVEFTVSDPKPLIPDTISGPYEVVRSGICLSGISLKRRGYSQDSCSTNRQFAHHQAAAALLSQQRRPSSEPPIRG